MNNKLEEVLKVSNPKIVKLIANDIFDGNFLLRISTRKDKKYMIKSPYTKDKWVHFGNLNYEDYTKHKDKKRREAFRNRNKRWANMPTYTPAFMAYHLLW